MSNSFKKPSPLLKLANLLFSSIVVFLALFILSSGLTQIFSQAANEITITSQVSSSSDDAEEKVSSGSVSLSSSDLELGGESGGSKPQIVGMRFTDVQVPKGATITNAYIEFDVDEKDSVATNLTIRGEAVADAAAFTSQKRNISSRPVTSASVSWNNVPPWTSKNEKKQTPDIRAIAQEIVGRSGWSKGNALVITIEGSGERTTESYNGERANAPLLVVTYLESASPTPTPTLVSYTPTPAPTSASYYVDCQNGNDANTGKAASSAWRTLTKAQNASLKPGEVLLLKRGCSWNGQFKVAWTGTQNNPITVSAYGSGALPVIENSPNTNVRIEGSYLVIENIHTRHIPSSYPPKDPSLPAGCENQPVGWRLGFTLANSASYVTIQKIKTEGHSIGIYVERDSHHHKILNNTLSDNTGLEKMTATTNLGATGLRLNGNDTEVANNTFTGNRMICSFTDGIESNSIELFTAQRNTIHHNKSSDRVFTEMGSSAVKQATDNVFAYNLHVSGYNGVPGSSTNYGPRFVVTRGEGHEFGPVWRTSLYDNTVYVTGGDGQGIICQLCGPTILTMKNNIVWASFKAVYVGPDGSAPRQPLASNNLFWDGISGKTNNFLQNFQLDATSLIADPLFRSPSTNLDNANFRLKSSSPAIDAGTNIPGFSSDLAGVKVPQGVAPDIGAYEYQ